VQLGLAGSLNRRHNSRDDGFTLVELVVAMFIIGGVLLSLITLQTKAMVSIAQAKERQQATAIANEVLEQLRALPWRSLTSGPAAYQAAYVSGGKLTVPGEPIEGETLVERSSAIGANDAASNSPLDGINGTNLTLHADPVLPGFEFKAYSFVTQKPVGVDEPYNLTVVVEWIPRGKTETRRVAARTIAFNPDSVCGNDDTRPYSSACQDFFVTQASASGPSLSISGAPIIYEGETPESGPYEILPGSNISEVSISGASVGVAIDAAQSAKVRIKVSGGSISVYDLDRNDQSRSQDGVSATASDSVTSGDKLDSLEQMLPITNFVPDPVSGEGMKLLFTTDSPRGDANAKTATSCGNWAADEHPCGIAIASNERQSVVLKVGDETINLAEVGASTITAQSARHPGGTTPVGGASHCVAATLVGSGCTEAEASLSPFTAVFPGVGAFTNHAPASSVGRGVGLTMHDSNASRGGPFSVSTADSDWTNAPNMEPDAFAESRTLAPIVIRDTEDIVVTADAVITVVPYNVHNVSEDPECRSEACTGRETVDAVRVDITYYVKHGSTEAAFTLSASLGDIHVSASYKASPKAWEDVD